MHIEPLMSVAQQMSPTDLTCYTSALSTRQGLAAHRLWSTQLRQTEKCFVATFKCYQLLCCGCCMFRGSPSFQCATGDSSGAERSEVRSFVTSIKQTGQGLTESHILWGTCLVIVSLSPTTLRRQQRVDEQIERLFDAGALSVCDTLILKPKGQDDRMGCLRSLWRVTDCFSNITGA